MELEQHSTAQHITVHRTTQHQPSHILNIHNELISITLILVIMRGWNTSQQQCLYIVTLEKKKTKTEIRTKYESFLLLFGERLKFISCYFCHIYSYITENIKIILILIH